jgi:hypothetical protein
MAKIYTDSEEARKTANAEKAKLAAEAKVRATLYLCLHYPDTSAYFSPGGGSELEG